MSDPKSSGSLADRITTKPADAPVSTSWADELASPTEPTQSTPIGLDGATEPRGGSELQEAEIEENDVKVELNARLAHYQQDPSNPLYSRKTFQELIP